jgi:hypothetical protein
VALVLDEQFFVVGQERVPGAIVSARRTRTSIATSPTLGFYVSGQASGQVIPGEDVVQLSGGPSDHGAASALSIWPRSTLSIGA